MAPTDDPPTPESGVLARHVALVGLMGAGKTAVGSALAMRIRRRHADLDRAVTQLAGRSIGVIFHEGGETAFRDLEFRCLELQLAGDDPIVLSTGGGVLSRDANQVALANRAIVVWLRARPETLAERVGDGVSRPLLEGQDTLEVLRDLADERHPTYQRVADLVVDTDGRSVEAVVDEVAKALSASWPDRPTGRPGRVGDRS